MPTAGMEISGSSYPEVNYFSLPMGDALRKYNTS
jgi:hypothetical protein